MVLGTVSSNRGHYERAITLLAEIEQKWPGWLSRLLTRRLSLVDFEEALRPAHDGIKTVIEIS